MEKYSICLDIGGTKVLGAIFDQKGDIVFRSKKKLKGKDATADVEKLIVSVVSDLLRSSDIPMDHIEAIAAGAPGVIDQEKGVVLFSPNLPWRDYPIRDHLKERFGRPFYIGNDVNVGVYGEWRYGAAKGCDHVVGLFVGTGIGGGLILDGKQFSGFGFKGAELGHLVVEPEGPVCGCGQRGCLESLSSKVGMTDYIRVQLRRGRESLMADTVTDTVFKSKAMKNAFMAGDEVMTEAICRSAHYLAIAAGSYINVFSPEMIVFGGGVMEALGDVFIEKVVAEIDRYAMPSIRNSVSICKAALGDDSVLYGALAMIEDHRAAAKR